MKVKSESEVAQSCQTLSDPMDCSQPPPQLEKNHVVPTAWQDEALARDGVSREGPCSALKKPQDSVLVVV